MHGKWGLSETHSEKLAYTWGLQPCSTFCLRGSSPGGEHYRKTAQSLDAQLTLRGQHRKAEWLLWASTEGRSYTLPAN